MFYDNIIENSAISDNTTNIYSRIEVMPRLEVKKLIPINLEETFEAPNDQKKLFASSKNNFEYSTNDLQNKKGNENVCPQNVTFNQMKESYEDSSMLPQNQYVPMNSGIRIPSLSIRPFDDLQVNSRNNENQLNIIQELPNSFQNKIQNNEYTFREISKESYLTSDNNGPFFSILRNPN